MYVRICISHNHYNHYDITYSTYIVASLVYVYLQCMEKIQNQTFISIPVTMNEVRMYVYVCMYFIICMYVDILILYGKTNLTNIGI